MKLIEAIYQLNPTIVTIRGDVAYDANEQVVEYDLAAAQALVAANEYKEQRASEYPDFKDYLDGIVKGDQAQIQAYIDACNAVKNKYPKGQV
jgi:ribosome-interacting GTPase 1